MYIGQGAYAIRPYKTHDSSNIQISPIVRAYSIRPSSLAGCTLRYCLCFRLAQQIDKQFICPWNPGWQLSEKCQRGINKSPFAIIAGY
jgi:hypothetical protein